MGRGGFAKITLICRGMAFQPHQMPAAVVVPVLLVRIATHVMRQRRQNFLQAPASYSTGIMDGGIDPAPPARGRFRRTVGLCRINGKGSAQ